ncbi:MAG: helix-turn-helix domain-containing protein [Gammaproteobacteria bacterium]|nr:helix-turn-helix domain-containing protein [Gammaproteobacteria bacterium]
MSYRGITYRLIPGTKARARQLVCLAGACRYVWNHFLGENQRLMAVHREDPENHPMPPTSFFSLGKEFTQLRLSTSWLQELSFSVVRHTLKYQADA